MLKGVLPPDTGGLHCAYSEVARSSADQLVAGKEPLPIERERHTNAEKQEGEHDCTLDSSGVGFRKPPFESVSDQSHDHEKQRRAEYLAGQLHDGRGACCLSKARKLEPSTVRDLKCQGQYRHQQASVGSSPNAPLFVCCYGVALIGIVPGLFCRRGHRGRLQQSTLWRLPEVSNLADRLPVAESGAPYQVAPHKPFIVKIFENPRARQRTALLVPYDNMPDYVFPSHKRAPSPSWGVPYTARRRRGGAPVRFQGRTGVWGRPGFDRPVRPS